MYIYIDSNGSQTYFNDNKAVAFRIKLPKLLKFYGQWEVALAELDMPQLESGYQTDYITLNTSLCTESVFNDSLRPVLRRIYKDQLKQTRHISYVTPYYVPVNAVEVDTIYVYLTDARQAQPSFQKGPLYCTLHLRPCTAL